MSIQNSRYAGSQPPGHAAALSNKRLLINRDTWLVRCCFRTCSRLVNYVRLYRKPEHRRRIEASRRVLRTLRRIAQPGAGAKFFRYVRQIDALTFEELVLTALEDAGYLVLRHRRYSGDGGIDGAFWHPRFGWYAIQAKRYCSHIDRQDVRDFSRTIREAKFDGGVFVHCGRSGAGVYEILRESKVVLLSGERLLSLILRGDLPH
jgi:restriction system protein